MENNDTPSTPEVKTPASRRERAKQAARKNRETVLMILLPVMFLLGLGTGWLTWGSGKTQLVDQQVNVPENTTRFDVQLDDDPSLGPADAPVTIVEFSDYQCPYCSKWHNEVFGRLIEEYGDQVRFVYRDFPLKSIHPDAVPAAEAANCAGEQNAYWEYHSALFSNRYGLGEQAYLQYALELNLNVDQFAACISDHRYNNEVEADFSYATGVGISSTPTFFINGLAVVGAQPYEVFKQVIDKELAEQAP